MILRFASCWKSENNKSFPQSNNDYWGGMLDTSGKKLWDKTFGGNEEERGLKMYELSTGHFIIIGSSNSPISGNVTTSSYGQSDFWLVKMDSIGNKIWDNNYGGTGYEHGGNGASLVPLPNGEFLFRGSTN